MIVSKPTITEGLQPPRSSVGALGPIHAVAVAELPTRFGHFRTVAFPADRDGKEHLALVRGDVRGALRVPVRVHSECLTGDVLGSLRCDCRDQLIHSLELIGARPLGVLLYMRQEGRGIGLTNKIRAYALQDLGHDTIEANYLLGFGRDQRDYRMAARMLVALGVRSVDLMTNNPAKIRGLREHGIQVEDRIPVVMPRNRYNSQYLDTKQRRAGHWLTAPPPDAHDLAPVSDSIWEASPSPRSNPCPNSM